MAFNSVKQKVLFLVPYPTEGASARLRVEQFLPFLDKAGIRYSLRPFFTPEFYRILYKKGNTIKKIAFFLFCACRRFIDIIKAPLYDTIFIHREVFPLGPPILEAILFLFGKRVIFDFDDAIYLPPEGSKGIIALLKCPWKTDYIIRRSSIVIAGNELLRQHALPLNKNVEVIPTCIDTDRYVRNARKDKKGEVVIGWVGSHTTQVFLKDIEGVLLELLSVYPQLKIHIIGAQEDLIIHDRVIIKSWSLEEEKADIMAFDIGIMPLPDTDWTRGKCAFKAILYMSFEIPVVVSAVGVNRDIIKDGVNGFLAYDGAEWKEKLGRLISDKALRDFIGVAGRSTAVKDFSLEANSEVFVDIITGVKN